MKRRAVRKAMYRLAVLKDRHARPRRINRQIARLKTRILTSQRRVARVNGDAQ